MKFVLIGLFLALCGVAPAAPIPPEQMVLKKLVEGIEVPELVCGAVTTGRSSSLEVWGGEAYATATFASVRNAKGRSTEALVPALDLTIHRYASSGDVEKDIQRCLFRERPAVPKAKEEYRGAAVYRYAYAPGHVIGQEGLYVFEISPRPRHGIPDALAIKVLQSLICQLQAARGEPAASIRR